MASLNPFETGKMHMIKDFSKTIAEAAKRAGQATASAASSREAMDCFDLTTLKGTETLADIQALCAEAVKRQVASVCINPEWVAEAAKALSKAPSVRVATVINFPHGNERTRKAEPATPETTIADVRQAIADGARQIDIVLAHEAFLNGDRAYAESLLRACREACGEQAKMLVIVESAAYEREEDLRDACRLALECGTDGLKTSTGMHPAGGARLETAAVLMEEAAQAGKPVIVKVSGGIKTDADCARFAALAHQSMGPEKLGPEQFRIGASSVLPELVRSCENARKGPPALPPSLDL